MRRSLIAAAALAVLLAGCSAGKEDDSDQPAPAPPASDVLDELERARPGTVLQDFVRAAARRDEQRMWERLSVPTKRRLGPSLTAFRHGAAEKLARDLRSLGRRHELLLSQAITPTFAVAAVERKGRTFAAALRQEDGVWRVELAGSVRLKPLNPHPNERVGRRAQIVAEVAAKTAIVEAGLWVDGLAIPSRGGALNPRQLTMFTETAPLRPGLHSVVAFASTDTDASALTWTFRAGG